MSKMIARFALDALHFHRHLESWQINGPVSSKKNGGGINKEQSECSNDQQVPSDHIGVAWDICCNSQPVPCWVITEYAGKVTVRLEIQIMIDFFNRALGVSNFWSR
jgi:hypothetical protein